LNVDDLCLRPWRPTYISTFAVPKIG
jgi:hypothetical protein